MEKLVLFYPQGHQAHFENGHPERPERIEIVRRALDANNWWERFEKVSPLELNLDFLGSIHQPSYLGRLQDASKAAERLDQDTFTTTASWQLALNAAGGAAKLAEMVWLNNPPDAGQPKLRGFALCRPPGHHAESGRGMGFCLLNNIAIAAQHLLASGDVRRFQARRLAIVDLDLHHGNGTQDIFWQRNDVLFISTHQSPLYPGSGALADIGSGDGLGYNANLPFPPATGDTGYRVAMQEVILPLLARFQPEMILVSLGFDPHWRDPLGHLMLSVDGYGSLVKSLVDWADLNCQSRIVFVMEGGYDSTSVAGCSLASVAAILGENYKDTIGPSPNPEGKSWQAVVKQAKQIWQL